MRTILTAPLLLSTAVLLAACANWPGGGTPATAAAAASCEVAAAPRDGTGCQRVWYGERGRPEAMQVLATYYYEGGHVQRLVGQVPHGASYECHYRDGSLDTARSRNTANCPRESEARP